MKLGFNYIFILCMLVGSGSCAENNSNVPEPEAKKNFTGCRLERTTSIATWDPTIIDENVYVYNASNQLVETKHYYRGAYNGSTTYFYNAQGKLIRSEPYSFFYEYNASGQLIKDGRQNHISQVYNYNTAGQVDSSWLDMLVDNVFKPQYLITYTYDVRNRLLKRTGFEINANGVINPVPYDSGYVVAYDNYKNPYALPSYIFSHTDPFITKNNILETDEQLFTYVYRPDSLVSEVTSASKPGAGINGGGTTKFFYECR